MHDLKVETVSLLANIIEKNFCLKANILRFGEYLYIYVFCHTVMKQFELSSDQAE